MKHTELHGIPWLAKTSDLALHIYVEVSYSCGVEMMEFLIFKDEKDFTDNREEAI